MKKILVPVDFSPSSKNIMRFAIDTAIKAGADIQFFHSYYDQIVLQGMSGTDTVESLPMMDMKFSAEVRDRSKKQMKALCEELKEEFTKDGKKLPEWNWIVEGGDFETEIRIACQDYKPDLVIIGSEGHGKKDPYSGSVSARLFKHARVPVFAVNNSIAPNQLNNILFLSDFSQTMNSRVRYLLEFAELYKARVHCRHLHLDTKEMFDDVKAESLRQDFNDEVNAGLIDFEITACKEAEEGLSEVFKEFQPDVIAFHVKQHSFLYHMFHNTITRKDIFRTGKPLLVFGPESLTD